MPKETMAETIKRQEAELKRHRDFLLALGQGEDIEWTPGVDWPSAGGGTAQVRYGLVEGGRFGIKAVTEANPTLRVRHASIITPEEWGREPGSLIKDSGLWDRLCSGKLAGEITVRAAAELVKSRGWRVQYNPLPEAVTCFVYSASDEELCWRSATIGAIGDRNFAVAIAKGRALKLAVQAAREKEAASA